MEFDYQVYKKVKAQYQNNIAVFRNLGRNKLAFSDITGRFSSESNASRIFTNWGNEGRTASSADGFLFPIVSLCYEGCRKAIKIADRKHDYINDISTIEQALISLRATYERQQQGLFKKDKNNQIINVDKAINVCLNFKTIAQNSTGFEQKSYREANQLFAKETGYRSTSNYRVFPELVKNNVKLQELIAECSLFSEFLDQDKDIENLEETGQIINPIFLEKAMVIGSKLYKKLYSEAENVDTKTIDETPGRYWLNVTRITRSLESNYREGFYQNTMQAVIAEKQNFEMEQAQLVANGIKRRPAAYPMETLLHSINQHCAGDFLYFSATGARLRVTQTTCRLYLNVKPNWNSHEIVIREIISQISQPDWLGSVSDFKTTHMSNYRKDTFCIYMVNESKARQLGVIFAANNNIKPHLNPVTANMQRRLSEGIAIGVEPETLIGNFEYTGFSKAWSFGSYNCFLVAWGLVRATQEGVQFNEQDYIEKSLFHVMKVFEENGKDIQKGHKAFIKYSNSLVGDKLTNFYLMRNLEQIAARRNV